MTTATVSIDLTAVRDHVAAHLDRLATSGGVEFLTVDGQTRGVVMAPDVYDRMAERIEQAEITAALRRGLADVAAGRVVPARDVMDRLSADLDEYVRQNPE